MNKWLIAVLGAAAVLLCFGLLSRVTLRHAYAQGLYAPTPSEWPKAPSDWMEFAPGTDEQSYIQGQWYWMGKIYGPPDERPGAKPNKGFDVEHDDVAKWMAGLKRPDSPPDSCCGKGDGYEVEIIRDGGDDSEWIAKITHGEPREYPDHTRRTPLPNGTLFHVRPQHVVKMNQGNPTKTAWIFAYVGTRTVTVYCLVPLPPSF